MHFLYRDRWENIGRRHCQIGHQERTCRYRGSRKIVVLLIDVRLKALVEFDIILCMYAIVCIFL